MIILYLAVLITALYWVAKVLLPEMAKPPIPNPARYLQKPKVDFEPSRMERLETLLDEKNRNIILLQKELKVFQVQVRDFEKIKTILEEEIRHLREQNRMFRSELGLSSELPKVESIT